MDPMDIDNLNLVDVPDTPERLTTRVTGGASYQEMKHLSPPISYRVEQRDEGCSRDKPILIGSGSKKPLRLPKPVNSVQQAAFSSDTSHPMRNPPLFRKGGLAGNRRVELRKKLGLVNGASDFGSTEGSEFIADAQNKPGNNGGFLSRNPIASPSNKQKRLVRNGCISPHNIATAKKLDVKDTSCPLTSEAVASSSPCSSVNISDLVAEVGDSHRRKGKGILTQPCSYGEPPLPHKNLCIRSSNCDEKDLEKGDYVKDAGKSIEGSAGWRTTHNKSREMDGLAFNAARETDESNRFPVDRTVRKGKGLSNVAGNDYSEDAKLLSSVNGCPKESAPYSNSLLGQHNRQHSATNKHGKRKKQGSTSNNVGESSTLVTDGHEAMGLNSTAQKADPRSTSVHTNNIQPIVEIDEFSPQPRRDTSDEEAKARQVEADELLARELQEQFYNEAPFRGIGEVDRHLTLASQHRDVSEQGSRPARQPRARRSFVAELRRQSRSWTASTAPRREAVAGASTLGRMARTRVHFPGRPRTLLPSGGSTSMFPADMDVEVRMQILGALEEFSDMNAGILNTQRDFTEDDYEMLLALDENNNVHSGASNSQINGLPQSTVQTDNFEEACAVCLETPTIGDTIRHLPCLHKFHKDCIDPWLRRRRSCPVCKSSIT